MKRTTLLYTLLLVLLLFTVKVGAEIDSVVFFPDTTHECLVRIDTITKVDTVICCTTNYVDQDRVEIHCRTYLNITYREVWAPKVQVWLTPILLMERLRAYEALSVIDHD